MTQQVVVQLQSRNLGWWLTLAFDKSRYTHRQAKGFWQHIISSKPENELILPAVPLL